MKNILYKKTLMAIALFALVLGLAACSSPSSGTNSGTSVGVVTNLNQNTTTNSVIPAPQTRQS